MERNGCEHAFQIDCLLRREELDKWFDLVPVDHLLAKKPWRLSPDHFHCGSWGRIRGKILVQDHRAQKVTFWFRLQAHPKPSETS